MRNSDERLGLTEKQGDAVLKLAGELRRLGVNPVAFLSETVNAEAQAQSLLRTQEESSDVAARLEPLLSVRPIRFEQVDLLRAPSVLKEIEWLRSRAWGSPKGRAALARISKSICGTYPRGKPRSYAEFAEARMRYSWFLSIWDEILKASGRPPRTRRGCDARLPRMEIGARKQALIAIHAEALRNASEARALSRKENRPSSKWRFQGRSRRMYTPVALPEPKARAALVLLGKQLEDADEALAEVERLRKIACRPWKRAPKVQAART